jgi:TonB family protein
MRRSMAALTLTVALATAPAWTRAEPLAAQPAAQPPAAPPAPDPALVYYPPAAKAAGVEGQVVLSCGHDEHLAVKRCTVVSEIPAGQGFAAAALAMAAQSPDNPKIALPDEPAKPPEQVTIRFSLSPPQIIPDITRMAHTVAKPDVISQPTAAEIQAAYPERALADQVQGAAAIDCQVMANGKLAGCRVAGELPAGYGFGQAAIDLAGDFVMKPRAVDGEPVGGAIVRVGVNFSPGDATAPLSLDTKPAAGEKP